MIVKVIIKRDVVQGKESDFFHHLKSLRALALNQRGYISGETLIQMDSPSKVLVISKWESRKDWEAWKNKPQRNEVESILSTLQYNETVYESYVFKKWYAAADLGFPPPLQKIEI